MIYHGAVYTEILSEPPLNRREALRYSGAAGGVEDAEKLLDEAIAICNGKFVYKVCYREFPVKKENGTVSLGFLETASTALAKNLEGCESVVVFAATVGIEADRLMTRYASTSPSKALMIQALGAERIEGLCDAFCDMKEKEYGKKFRPRFSPGYGDFPLEMQREIFGVLCPQNKIGLTLNASLLMSPTKSVTAIVGVGEKREKI